MKASFTEKLPCLPFQLEQSYTVMTTYKWDDDGFTCLVRKTDDNRNYILKYSVNPFQIKSLVTEKELLDYIHQQNNVFADSFPKALELIQKEDAACFIREYIAGQTLEDICESNLDSPGIDLLRALDFIISTVELLGFLHTLKKPIIHRDIKPQNIVIDSEGKCHFIDMGISRFYQKGKQVDTDSLGTRLTAPPEQYGYQQTDSRSDLYSVGVLLFYCLTGEYSVRSDAYPDIPDSVMRIIQKATKFDPSQRYHNADELMKDLLAVRYSQYMDPAVQKSSVKPIVKKKHLRLTAISLVLVLGLSGFYYLKNNSNHNAGNTKDTYVFQEPLIEAAVRQELGLSREEDISFSELSKITGIHIYGQQIYQDESELWYNWEQPWFYDQNIQEAGRHRLAGNISSLEDIKAMPNLKELYLGKQQIKDITPLKNLELTSLGLASNPISDFSPLEGNSKIKALNLTGCKASSYEFLSTMENLSSLTLTDSDITTLEPLMGLPLKELELYGVVLKEYQDFRYVPGLTSLSLRYFSEDWISFMEGMELEKLMILSTSNLNLSTLNVFPTLQELYCGGNRLEVAKLQGFQLPELGQLNLYEYTIEDFHDLAGAKIARLEIYGSEVKDYMGLDQMTKLQEISCTKEQANHIEKAYPEHHWSLLYPE